MGLLATIAGPLAERASAAPNWVIVVSTLVALVTVSVVLNVLNQLLFKNPNEPPVVFHWFPIIGNTVTYGIDPYRFFSNAKLRWALPMDHRYGDMFTFILLGKKTTVCLGVRGNDFILNGKLKDLNAEEIYSPLTTPVFGKDVVYDCPNSKLMEQKKFMKFGLTTESFRNYVDQITSEVQEFIKKSPAFKGNKGTFNVPPTIAELTIYTASRSLQGREVRAKFDSTFADLYHDLDMGFSPINFILSWFPLPHNRKRDFAQRKLATTYMEIIQARRDAGNKGQEQDMIWNLMGCTYKDGTPVPDMEIAHMMIALLMAGQHSSSSTMSWIILRLASQPHVIDELYREQKEVFGENFAPITYEDLSRLPLNSQVIRETLRLHSPIHSIMRKVKQPLPVSDTPYTIPPAHVLLASPGAAAREPAYFKNPAFWDPHRWDEGNDGVQLNVEEDEEQVDWGYGLMSKGTASPYLPFGAGRHRCIGEQFAYVQLGTILANLVREFKFRNVDGGSDVVGTDYSSLFSRPIAPAVVQWERK